MNKIIILTTVVAIAVGATTSSLYYYASHNRTCSADNQAYHSVLKNWGKTNVIDLSRVLTRMDKDNCKVGGGA